MNLALVSWCIEKERETNAKYQFNIRISWAFCILVTGFYSVPLHTNTKLDLLEIPLQICMCCILCAIWIAYNEHTIHMTCMLLLLLLQTKIKWKVTLFCLFSFYTFSVFAFPLNLYWCYVWCALLGASHKIHECYIEKAKI